MKQVLKIIFIIIIAVSLARPVSAVCMYNCTTSTSCSPSCGTGQECCGDGTSGNCYCQSITGSGNNNTNNTFGKIENPLPGGSLGPGGGLITLLNNVFRLMFVAAGIYAFVQIVLAGFKFISSSGDTKKIEQAWNSINQSLIGLVVIILSLALAGLIGLLLFGDATAILNPKIYGPGP